MIPETVQVVYAQTFKTSLPYDTILHQDVHQVGCKAWDGIATAIADALKINESYIPRPAHFALSSPNLGIAKFHDNTSVHDQIASAAEISHFPDSVPLVLVPLKTIQPAAIEDVLSTTLLTFLSTQNFWTPKAGLSPPIQVVISEITNRKDDRPEEDEGNHCLGAKNQIRSDFEKEFSSWKKILRENLLKLFGDA
ncbi:hypothetical protein HK097_000991 [Rhizophlyctis rosea]|uniref:Uncharacterized protein n=1 Tax=Rhizophlyctis rosea TaxID=64517 RepID=A0AAD5S7G8_9FUNG|nr:hypothetical protein HK097_000991 [Rhizophlyctis rosea]